ncbi:hypothetical protein Dimus_010699 [Dionaea muscipula]
MKGNTKEAEEWRFDGRGGAQFRRFSGGRLAPPASPRRRSSFVGSRLTHPCHTRSFMEDCRRALRAVKPTLVWDYESRRNRNFRLKTVAEGVLMDEPGLIVEENQLAVLDSLEGRSSCEIPPPDLDVSPSPVEASLRLSLGSIVEGTMGSFKGVDFPEGVISKGEAMEYGLRPDLESSPWLGVQLMPADEEQGLPATILPEGQASIEGLESVLATDVVASCSINEVASIDDLRKLHVEARVDGEGVPELSPDAAIVQLCVPDLGLTAARGTDPVVAGNVDNGEIQDRAPSTGPFPLFSRSTALPVQVMADELGFADELAAVSFEWTASFLLFVELQCFFYMVVVVVGGIVSEEAMVPPVAGATLRPKPTDGLRPPLLPAGTALVVGSEPGVLSEVALTSIELVVVVRSGLGLIGTGCTPDRSSPMLDDQGWQQSQRRRGRASVGSSRGQQKASDRVRARRLVRRLAMVKVMDGEFRARLGCRRSDRLSSPANHAPAALGGVRSSDLKPIDELLESEGVSDTDGSVSVDVKLAHGDNDNDDSGVLMLASSALGDGPVVSCPIPIPLLPLSGEAGALGCVGDSVAANSDLVPGAVSGEFQVNLSFSEEPIVEAVALGGDGGSMAVLVAQSPGDASVASQGNLSCSQVEPKRLEDFPIGMADLVLNSSVELDGEHGQVVGDVVFSRFSAGVGDNGSFVSGQPGPVVEGSDRGRRLIDGRQQQPLMPAVSSFPVSGVGQDGHGGSEVVMVGCGEGLSRGDGDGGSGGGIASMGVGRSYASAVDPVRSSDVRLHFVPSVIPDDGEEVCMLDSDRDELEWGVCLVGHFLQSGVPFSVVRPRLLHLWRTEGLVEVRSLDLGFFLFRFSSPEGRDKILEGGPWFVGGKPLFLRRWERMMSLTRETLTRIPVWASFYNVPLEYWTRTVESNCECSGTSIVYGSVHGLQIEIGICSGMCGGGCGTAVSA